MYFKNFPRVILDGSTGATGSSVIAVDILRRVGFNNTGKTGSEFFVEYNIGDTETPESIANHIYGSPEYHWVVLMFNDKFDAFFEWPLSVRKFEKYMTKKYQGITLFFADGVTGSFLPNDTLVKTSGTGLTGWGGLVDEYDPTLNKLTITGVGSGYEFSADDLVKSYNATGGTLLTQNVGEAVVKRIVTDSSQALHHFETSGSTFDGYDDIGGGSQTAKIRLDPLSKYNGITQVSMGSGGVTFGNTLLYGYTYNSSSNYVKTNYDYETEQNEDKRKISLLNPTHLDQVIREFKSLISKR